MFFEASIPGRRCVNEAKILPVTRPQVYASLSWLKASDIDGGLEPLQGELLMSDQTPLRYRLLTGPDDKSFCQRISDALDQGYKLYGSPSMTFNGERVIVAQAVVLPNADAD